jgi:predicted nuclease of restriction endonuclease-like (RecB) superfamily
MKETKIQEVNNYDKLVSQISETYVSGKQKAIAAVNQHITETYWKVGEHIVEFEQDGKQRAEYGSGLLEKLSKDLSLLHGKGFSVSNIQRMRQLYDEYSNYATVSHKLSWSHYVELLKIDDKLERSFYEKQCLLENWSIRELKRQKKSSLFLRLAASKDKDGILQLAKEGQIVEKPADIIREPYVLDFLHIPEPYHLSESELEDRIIGSLQNFLLELGKGFAFVGRQYRITLGNRHFRVDLVFYHRILKCFVLIDLKKNEAGYEDIGQMNMYLGYFQNEESTESDNPPIGIVLAREKDELLVKYAMHNISSQLFVSQYQLYLPNRDELKALIEKQLNEDEENGDE